MTIPSLCHSNEVTVGIHAFFRIVFPLLFFNITLASIHLIMSVSYTEEHSHTRYLPGGYIYR